LLKSLQDQLLNARQEEREKSLIFSKVSKENKKIAEPMAFDQSDKTRLSKDLESYVKEKETVRVAESQLSDLNGRLGDLKWQHEIHLQKLLVIQKERDACKPQFQSHIYRSQQQNEFRNLLLEKKLVGLLERGEQQTATLNEILVCGNFDSESVRRIQSQITNVVQCKTDQISNLEQRLEKAIRAKMNLEKIMQATYMAKRKIKF